LAVHLLPPYDTTLPETYAWFDTQAAAEQPPELDVGVGVGVGVGDDVVGVGVGVGEDVTDVFLANATVYAVKSHGFCVTLLHSLDV
jgi:hypothetical protein